MTAQHDSELRDTQDQLAEARRVIAAVAQWIHNPAWDRDARTALAETAGLPGPTKEQPCTTPPTSPLTFAPPPTRPAPLASNT